MYIELVDSLRCVEAHEETWLVAAVTRLEGRHIVEGTLGCPICRRQYAVRAGVGWFTQRQPTETGESLTATVPSADEEETIRAAALLGLTDPGGIVVLGGSWARHADAVARLGAAHVVVLDADATASSSQEVSSLVVDDALPFGTATVRAVAVDGAIATPALLDSAVQRLRSRGRLVAPSSASTPGGVSELARDETDWVGERTATTSAPIPLRSARR
jgi:hypothetical protein